MSDWSVQLWIYSDSFVLVIDGFSNVCIRRDGQVANVLPVIVQIIFNTGCGITHL